jgi:hypothetical protein
VYDNFDVLAGGYGGLSPHSLAAVVAVAADDTRRHRADPPFAHGRRWQCPHPIADNRIKNNQKSNQAILNLYFEQNHHVLKKRARDRE